MAKRKLTAEELLARAESSGYREVCIERKTAVETTGIQAKLRGIKRGVGLTPRPKWRLKDVQKDSLQRGLLIPGRASARQHYLCNGVDDPDLATVKDFFCFYIATSRGRIKKKGRPMADSAKTFAEWFFAGFTCITGTPIEKEYSGEVYNVNALP